MKVVSPSVSGCAHEGSTLLSFFLFLFVSLICVRYCSSIQTSDEVQEVMERSATTIWKSVATSGGESAACFLHALVIWFTANGSSLTAHYSHLASYEAPGNALLRS